MVGQQLRPGFTLAGRAVRAWGTPQFWKYIGWWHQETHYDIPFDRKVRGMEKALSECFDTQTRVYRVVNNPCVSVSNINTSNCTFNIPVNIRQNSNFIVGQDSKGRAGINFLPLGVKTAGSYHVTDLNMVLQSSRKPGPLPRLLLKFLLGIHWSDAEEKTQDEYTTRQLNELGRNG